MRISLERGSSTVYIAALRLLRRFRPAGAKPGSSGTPVVPGNYGSETSGDEGPGKPPPQGMRHVFTLDVRPVTRRITGLWGTSGTMLQNLSVGMDFFCEKNLKPVDSPLG